MSTPPLSDETELGHIDVDTEDSDATVALFPPELKAIGKALGSPLYYLAQMVPATLVMMTPPVAASGAASNCGMAKPSKIISLGYGMLAVVFAGQMLITRAARIAVAPGADGISLLEQMGAGTTKISARSARSLTRWRIGLNGMSIVFILRACDAFMNAAYRKGCWPKLHFPLCLA